ncbi:hypothetical protein ABID99_001253 [Mucilaginibacter sp. OAE612]|uniref:hypothetical protein n=1 Tax=Mucilaginibacter sp. OAE612 TaxID=3156444 RepID=UPI00359E3A72
MRPLIFEYAEIPKDDHTTFDEIEYDSKLHLNVLKSTGQPAINEVTFITETFTKAEVDTSESDDNFRFAIRQSIDTRIYTRQLNGDETDGDVDQLQLQPRSVN